MTVYARLEKTTDSTTLQYAPERTKEKGWHDVCIYGDANCTQFMGRFPHYYSNKPTRRNKYVTLNCCRYNLIWIP